MTTPPMDTSLPQLIAKLDERSGPVYSLAWSPDGKVLASAGYGEVKIWNPNAAQSLVTLKGHSSFVWSIAWSPDGNTLASAGQDGTVRLWEIKTYTTTMLLKTGWAFSLAWSPDGKQLAVSTQSGAVRIYTVDDGQEQYTLAGRNMVISLAWSPDGRTLAAGYLNGDLRLWDTAEWEISKSFSDYTSDRCDINGLAWSPDGRLLASAHQDGVVRLWDIKTDKPVRSLLISPGWARGVVWSPDGRWLVAGGESRKVLIWDRETGEAVLRLTDSAYPVWSVAWSPDGNYLAAGNGSYEIKNQGQVFIWALQNSLAATSASPTATPISADGFGQLVPITPANAKDARLLRTLPIPDFAVSNLSQCSVDFSPDGKLLSGVCYKNTIPVWNVSIDRLLFSLAKSPVQAVAVSFSPDGKMIATGDYSGKISLYNTATGELIRIFKPLSSAVWELDFSPDGNQLASASFYTGMHLWDVASGEPLWNYGEKDRLRVLSVNYHPTGETIAYGTLSNGVMILNAKTGQPIKNLPIDDPVGDVAFSPDGQWLAAGSDDNKIQLWRTSDYELEKTMEGHAHYVNGVAFSPDGRLLVSGSHDKKVGIWDVRSGQLIKLLGGHAQEVLRVAVDPSGTRIASISWDGTVRFWGVEGDKVGTPIESVSLTTEDKITLSATLFGQGKLAVILAHQGTEGTDQTSWQPFARLLAEQGYVALTLDFRGRGQSQGYLQANQLIKDVNAAIQFLRGRGYQRIVCMGASMGGTACLRAALDHDLAGLVVIASPMSSGLPTAVKPDELSRLTLPKLFICAENDRYSPVIPQMKQMFDLSPDPKQLKFFPGTAHGTELFDTEYGDEFRQLLLNFVEGLK